MSKRIILQVFAFVILLPAAVSAQTRFTSMYTSLSQGCKTLKGENGTDDAFICGGATGYQIRIFSSAAAMFINAELKATDETFNLATLDLDFDESKRRVEWRLADGKPFAAIIRVPKYGPPKTSDLYFGEVVGEELLVRGLKGHEKISGQVDAKTPNANEKARKLADEAYTPARVAPKLKASS